MKNLIIVQIIISALSAALVYYSNAQQYTLEVILGALFTLLNLLFYGWIFVILLRKKLIALGLSLIVIKYALLAGSLYLLLNKPGIHVLWIAAGVGTLAPTIIIVGLIQTFKKGSEN